MSQEKDTNNLNNGVDPNDASSNLDSSNDTALKQDFPEISLELDDDEFNDLVNKSLENNDDNSSTNANASANESTPSTNSGEEDPANSEGNQTTTFSEDADDRAIAAYNIWVEKGLIPESDNFDGTFDSLDKITTDLPKTIANALVSNAPKLGQDLIEYVFTKGNNLSKEDLTSFMDTHLKSVDLSSREAFTEDLAAKEYLYSKYQNLNLDDDVIDTMLDKLEEKGTILAKANELLSEDKTALEQQKQSVLQEEAKQREIVARQAEKFQEDMIQSLQATGWEKSRISTIANEYNSGITQKKFDKIVADPKSFIHLVNLLTYYDDEKQDFNFEDFVKMSSSKETKKIKKNLEDHFTSSVAKNKSVKNNSNSKGFNLDDYISIN